jgi:hypothetical protein
LEYSKGQKEPWTGAKSPFGVFKRTKGAVNRSKKSFWSIQKDKRSRELKQNVLLKLSKGQKEPWTGANCSFGASKRTKGAIDRNKMSFWSVQKDKNNRGTEHIWSF